MIVIINIHLVIAINKNVNTLVDLLASIKESMNFKLINITLSFTLINSFTSFSSSYLK